jgi:hypothetical protein
MYVPSPILQPSASTTKENRQTSPGFIENYLVESPLVLYKVYFFVEKQLTPLPSSNTKPLL